MQNRLSNNFVEIRYIFGQWRSPAALSHTDSLKFTFKTYKAPGSFEPGALLSSFYQ